MTPPTLKELSDLESALPFRFPSSFRAFIERGSEGLPEVLDRCRFIVSSDEIQSLHQEAVPSSLVPFLAEEQPSHTDYYCFDLSTQGPEYAVVVFAIHATVARWENFAAWLTHLRGPKP